MIRRSCKRRRVASISLELLLLLPIVLFICLAIVMFSVIETHEHQLVHASQLGCRVAAQGGRDEDVIKEVHRSLASERLRSTVKIEIECEENLDDYVVVRVWVPARKVVPNLLRYMGCALRDENLIGQTVMRRE